MKRISFAAAAAALLASVVTVHTAFAADPIKIGVPVGLSGANSVVAPSVVQSATAAARPVRKRPSIR
jgi:urea transport system substrate-binding protein